MKTPNYLSGVLVLALALAHGASADQMPWLPAGLRAPLVAPAWTLDLTTVASEDASRFADRVNQLQAAAKYETLQQGGHLRRVAHPENAVAWAAEASGAYLLGDVDTAIASAEMAIKLKPDIKVDGFLRTARAVRRNYPNQQFQPLEFVDSEASLEVAKWEEKAKTLLAAKNYDEIERVARELQTSKAATVTARPYLTTFFKMLSASDAANQTAIKSWRAARPNSDLARDVEIDMWTNVAWSARGNGTAADITPGKGNAMSDALSKAASVINELPATASSSPLMFVALQNWSQLSGIGREFQDAVFEEGTEKFPDYNTLYYQRTEFMMPRWYGKPGDFEAMIKTRADQIGGIEGDIFYARGIMEGTSVMPIYDDNPYDIARANRGLSALRARYPDSPTLRSAQILLGIDEAYANPKNEDWELVKSAIAEPNGQRLDGSYGNFMTSSYRQKYANYRMATLAESPPK